MTGTLTVLGERDERLVYKRHVRLVDVQPEQAETSGSGAADNVEELERLSDHLGDSWSMTGDFKEKYLRGAGELELVRSGLDDTMRGAYQAMREMWRSRDDVTDLRTAAYIVSIGRVSDSYRAKGL